jgi:hypothetical protein
MSTKISKGARLYLLGTVERLQYGAARYGVQVRHFSDPTAMASTRHLHPRPSTALFSIPWSKLDLAEVSS